MMILLFSFAPLTSWVYLFSKFTSEALLFETLLICILCAAYAAFWVLRKRKLGSTEIVIPVGLVKTYLNELIGDAEQLRTQLFGLFTAQGILVPSQIPISGSIPALVTASQVPQVTQIVDPDILKKMVELETKMAEQAKVMETILVEKTKIEKELTELKNKSTPTSTGISAGDVVKMQEKIKVLEARLAEYSVIEDDLANLKRLQQENTQLKVTLTGAGISTVPAMVDTPGSTPAVAEAEVTPDMAAAVPTLGEPTASAVAEVAVAPIVDKASSTEEASFENLVDQVEQSLEASEPMPSESSSPDTSSSDAVVPPITLIPSIGSVDKSDEDLVAEFEKMLNS